MLTLIVTLLLMTTLLVYFFLRSWVKADDDLIHFMQSRYTSMFEKHNSIMLLVDPHDGAIVDANESAIKFYGYSHSEFLSLKIHDINELDQEKIVLYKQQAMKREKNYFIFQHKLKNGDIRTVEVFASPIETEDKPLMFSIIRDITKEKENEEKLKALSLQTEADRQRYQAFMKYASNGVFIMDIEGNLKECSQMAANMLGYSMKEMTTLHVTDWDAMIPADELPELFRSTSTQTPIYFESKHVRKDGSTYDAAIASIQIIINGELLIYASVRDITDYKLLENELLEKNRELQKTQLKFQTLFEESLDGIVLMDLNTQQFIEFNHHACEMYGYTKEEFKLLTPQDLEALENQEEILATQQAIIEQGWGRFATQHKTKDGELKDIIVSVKVYNMENQNFLHATFHDITEIKRQAELIEKQNEEFKTIFDISRDGIVIVDLESNFLDFNDAYLSISGFTREELLSTSCLALSIPEDHERIKQAIQIVLETGYLDTFEKICLNKTGKQMIVNLALSLMPDKKRIMASVKDITDIRNHEQQLEFIAHYDPLTKLPNRVLLSDRMKQSIANAHRNNGKLAIAYLDLDGFKQVNDTYGHDAGDILLIEVSKRMQSVLREGDTIARLGGDEFVAILANQNDEGETFTILNRLLEAASSPMDITSAVVTVSASIGVTFYSQEYGVDADILLRQADQAMYEAKLRGKNRIAIFEKK